MRRASASDNAAVRLRVLALWMTLLGATIAVASQAQTTDANADAQIADANAKAQTTDANADARGTDHVDSGLAWPQTFRDWWQTPSQQAAQAFRQGDNERLQRVAPTRAWRGAAAYRNQDYTAAQRAYSVADDATPPPANSLDEQRRRYNSATTEIQLGDYTAAIEQLDELLSVDPDNRDAARNRAIAQRLLELEQQSQQGAGGEPGENSEPQNGEPQDSEPQDSESGENASGEQPEGDPSEAESEPDADNGSRENSGEAEPSSEPNSEDDSEGEPGTQDEREQEIEAARQALQEANADAETETAAEQLESAIAADEPMSEEDQATEQWLRQIPDDPDDLLRRKLLQNHLSEYPDVQRNGNQY